MDREGGEPVNGPVRVDAPAGDALLVIVVDDDAAFRELVTTALERNGYAVIATATGEDALEAMQLEQPALVLLDVHLEGMSGYDVCRVLRANVGDSLPIVFVSGERRESFDRVAGLRLGADDYLVKPLDPSELVARVDRLTGRARGATLSKPAPVSLTRRETEILALLVDGLRPKEVAHRLSISRKTVAVHIQNILMKLGVHSQAQAVAVALSNGLLPGRQVAGAAAQARDEPQMVPASAGRHADASAKTEAAPRA